MNMKKFLLILSVVVSIFIIAAVVLNAASVELTGKYDTIDTTNGEYTIQNNVWNSSVPAGSQSIQVDDSTGAFKVTNANFSVGTNGAPGSYPSIYKGTHWGSTTKNSGMPILISELQTLPSSWSFTTISSGSWNCAYDIWVNQTSTWGETQNPDGLELMIWLNHNGSIQPIGSVVATVEIAGSQWELWYGTGTWNTASFVKVNKATSCNFDLKEFLDECLNRGYIQNSWYLADVETGFEIWENGTGLSSDSFSVNVNSGTSQPPVSQEPTISEQPPVSQQPPSSQVPQTNVPTGQSGLDVDYNIINSWGSGGVVEITVTNNSQSNISNWNIELVFPGNQKISNMWNATYNQSGQTVSINSEVYNGNLSPGNSASFGFVFTGSEETPTINAN